MLFASLAMKPFEVLKSAEKILIISQLNTLKDPKTGTATALMNVFFN